MKKMLRIAAALAALLAMTNFIGCKNDDDDDETVAVEKVEITSTGKEVTAGETITLEATVSPENATDKTVTWTSADTAIATVDSTGKVTGVAAGTVKITAKAGEKTDAVDVTVKAAATSGGETGGSTGGTTGGETGGSTGGETTTIAVTEVKITSTVTEVTAGETITLTAEVSPADATDKTVTWTSSDTAIATVDSTGKVTGVAAGTAKITAKAGEKTAAVDVTVKAAATGGGETATPKTATIAYDGSSAENAPAATGEEGVFSDVQDVIATAGVAEGYSLDEGYPKYGSQTYTGDDKVKNGTTSAGMLFVSGLQDGKTPISFAANTVMAYVTYNFTLSAKSDVEAAVKAFNTQSSSLAGKIEILDSNGILKASKQADAGSKSANDVAADSVELEAGVYTLRFSWVLTKAADLKKVNCGISSFSIKATTK